MTAAGADIGAAPQPPSWCLPDAKPDYGSDKAGNPVTYWDRGVGDYAWIEGQDAVIDGRVFRSAVIGFSDPPDRKTGLNGTTALQLARELVAAAQLLDDGEGAAR
ncbi:hypothetical protein [Mycobacterium sp. pW045]|uniref:hypothetical protein n=1 Tax=Mycobacterium sp. pW045 TaxID=3238984 RepID=UPI00351B44BD